MKRRGFLKALLAAPLLPVAAKVAPAAPTLLGGWQSGLAPAKQRAEAESEHPAKDLKEKGYVAVEVQTTDQGLSAVQVAMMMNRGGG